MAPGQLAVHSDCDNARHRNARKSVLKVTRVQYVWQHSRPWRRTAWHETLECVQMQRSCKLMQCSHWYNRPSGAGRVRSLDLSGKRVLLPKLPSESIMAEVALERRSSPLDVKNIFVMDYHQDSQSRERDERGCARQLGHCGDCHLKRDADLIHVVRLFLLPLWLIGHRDIPLDRGC